MQFATGGGAQPRNVSGVLRDLRLKKDDVHDGAPFQAVTAESTFQFILNLPAGLGNLSGRRCRRIDQKITGSLQNGIPGGFI